MTVAKDDMKKIARMTAAEREAFKLARQEFDDGETLPAPEVSRSVVSSSTDGHSAGYRYGSSVGINSTKRLSAAAA